MNSRTPRRRDDGYYSLDGFRLRPPLRDDGYCSIDGLRLRSPAQESAFETRKEPAR